MFLLEIASWLVVSVLLVEIHRNLSPREHAKPNQLRLTGIIWGLTGGLLGAVTGLRAADTAATSVTSLILAGVATVSFLLLEWASGPEHQGPPARR